MVLLLLILLHPNRAKQHSKKFSCSLQGVPFGTKTEFETIIWIGLYCSCICKYIGHFWWSEEGSKWETTTTTTMPLSIPFTIVLIIYHKLNNTIASRMLFLVGLYFSMIEIGCLCVEIHLHDPWKTREGRGRMSTTAVAPKMHQNPQLKLVSKTYHHSLRHGIGTNSLLTKFY